MITETTRTDNYYEDIVKKYSASKKGMEDLYLLAYSLHVNEDSEASRQKAVYLHDAITRCEKSQAESFEKIKKLLLSVIAGR